jgi:hypothetical protein
MPKPAKLTIGSMPSVCTDRKLLHRFKSMFKCDGVRITKPCGKWFLILQWKENTAKDRKKNPDAGQWHRNGVPIDFDYVREEVVASGETKDKMIASAMHYKELQGMTMEQYLKGTLGIKAPASKETHRKLGKPKSSKIEAKTIQFRA